MKKIDIVHNSQFLLLGKYTCKTQQHIGSVAFPYPTIIIVLCGKKIIKNDHEEIAANVAEWALIPGGSFFGIENIPAMTRAYEALAVSFLVPPSIELDDSHERVKCQAIHPSNALESLMDMLLKSKNEISQNAMRYLMQAFYAELKMAGMLGCLFSPNTKQYTAKLMHIFSKKPSLNHTIDSTAAELNISRATLLRKLQAEGVTYKNILCKTRMSHALSLLQLGHNNRVIARECGYKSQLRFSENFQKFAGVNLEQYRSMTSPDNKIHDKLIN